MTKDEAQAEADRLNKEIPNGRRYSIRRQPFGPNWFVRLTRGTGKYG
jgi:hypothetical protein